MTLYHFTDSARLPHIIKSGGLRPGDNRVGDYPFDFLWATTSSVGDRTATSMLTPHFKEQYRMGKVFVVRITLHRHDFFPWEAAQERHPEWEDKHISVINRSAKIAGADPSTWWCRRDRLPLESIIAIEGKTYANNVWRPVGQDVSEVDQDGQRWLGISLDTKTYYSSRIYGENGRVGYEFGTPA